MNDNSVIPNRRSMQVSDHPDYRRTVETNSTTPDLTPDRAADLSPEQKRAAHAAANPDLSERLHAMAWHWPAFNVADSAIMIGVGIFFLASLLGRRVTSKLKPNDPR